MLSNSISRILNLLFTRKNGFIEFKAHLIHREHVPLLHNTVLIVCYEGDGLVGVIKALVFFRIGLTRM